MPGRATPPMPERLAPQWAMQRVDEGAVDIAGAWMHDEAGGLVDDDDGIVLIGDIERDSLRLPASRSPAAER